MANSKAHTAVPPEKFNNMGVAVPRLAIKSEIRLVDLMSLLTGNTKAGYTSAGAAAGNVALASTTPTRRDGAGNYCEWSLATDAGEYFLLTFATPQNLSSYNFLGMWMYSDTLTLGTDYDFELRNSAGDLIASFNVPALTAGVWQYVEIDISSYSRSDIKYIKIQCDVADNDVIDLFNLCAYEYGNGSGAVDGLCGEYTATEILAIGDYVSAIPGRAGYVKKSASNDPTVIGKCIKATASGAKTLVQETGRVYLRSASTITVGDACSAASATTADNDTTAGRPFGTWMEATGTAGADLLVELNTRGGVGTEVPVTQLGGYTRGDIIRGGAADWEDYVAKTAGFILIGDGTDVISKQFDWDDIAAGAGADVAHDHSAAGEGGEIPPASLTGYVRGDIIRGGAADWEAYVAKTAGFILIGDGTDVISKQFDWDDLAAGAGADMVHDHSAAGEGGAIAITAIPGYTRGDVIRGGAAAWEDYAAKTAGFILIGDGTDLISKQFDWDDLAAGAGADMVHDHSAAGEGGNFLIKTDYQFTPDFLEGRAESGTWTPTFNLSRPLLTRTPANNTTHVFQVALPVPSRTTASKGIKVTSVEMAYSCDAADVGDDIQVLVAKRSIPANGAAPGVISVIAGSNDGDYDANHNTSAKRSLDTGAPENHTLLMSVGVGSQAFVADGETWFLQIKAIEANDATGALAIIVKDVIVNYTNDVN